MLQRCHAVTKVSLRYKCTAPLGLDCGIYRPFYRGIAPLGLYFYRDTSSNAGITPLGFDSIPFCLYKGTAPPGLDYFVVRICATEVSPRWGSIVGYTVRSTEMPPRWGWSASLSKFVLQRYRPVLAIFFIATHLATQELPRWGSIQYHFVSMKVPPRRG